MMWLVNVKNSLVFKNNSCGVGYALVINISWQRSENTEDREDASVGKIVKTLNNLDCGHISDH